MVTALLEGKLLTRNRAIISVAIAAAFWSTSGLFIKLIDLSPLTIAGTRSLIAALLMITLINKKLRFRWSFPQIAGAVAYSVTVITFVTATKLTTAANAILLQYTVPVFTALLGAWLLREAVSRIDWIIITLVVGGMALFFFDKLTTGGFWGNVLAIISAGTFAFMIIFLRMQKKESPTETIILGNIITALICAPFIFQDPPTGSSWLPLFYLGIFQLGLPFVLYSTAIKYVTALDAVLVQTIEPLLNPIWVFLIIGEAPGKWAILGGIVVISTVTIRNIFFSRKEVKETPIAS
ncbi:MAG: EamA family transporter [Bacillota bacterium]|nr:EamA family transporter [Bacillota bacterium]